MLTGADISTNCHFDQSSKEDQQPLPLPVQSGHCSENSVSNPSPMRLRVISTRPNSEISKTRFVSYLGPTRGTSQLTLRGSLYFHVNEVDDDNAADISQPKCLAISSAASRLLLNTVSSRLTFRRSCRCSRRSPDGTGVLIDERTARWQPDLAIERLVYLFVHVVTLE